MYPNYRFRYITFIIFFFIYGIIFSLNVSYAEEVTRDYQQISNTQEPKLPFIGIITNDSINLRSGCNINFEVLCQLNKNDKIKILDKRYDWYKVELPKDSLCYISRDYVEHNGTESVIKGNNVNFRAGPGTNYNILGQLDQGSTVKILGEDQSWYKIEPPEGSAGWVHSKFVRYGCSIEEYSNADKVEQSKADTVKKTEISHREDISEREKPVPAETEKVKDKKVSQQTHLKETLAILGEPTATGVVVDLGKVMNRLGTHKLLKDGQIIYYLRSTDCDLNKYLYCKVSVWGEVSKSENQKYPVITVKKILALEFTAYTE